MIGLPADGQLVRIWPRPGRKIQHGERPLDPMGGGRWLTDEGAEVKWGPFFHEQMKAGDIMLHNPGPQTPEVEEKQEPFNFAKAASQHLANLAPKPEKSELKKGDK